MNKHVSMLEANRDYSEKKIRQSKVRRTRKATEVGGHGSGTGLTEIWGKLCRKRGMEGTERTRHRTSLRKGPQEGDYVEWERSPPTYHHGAQCGCSKESGERSGEMVREVVGRHDHGVLQAMGRPSVRDS